ncbi:glycosyltransferase [Novosphingobium aquae]|uniref:Glycosyltransferase n=1 Tax=Novosphingobium aquae TaxID=3133435 RepID=A0ABU8S6Z3_9SPHN
MPLLLPEPFQSDQRPLVIIYRGPVFNRSETFVRAQAEGLQRYQPLIVGRKLIGNIPTTLDGRLRINPSAVDLLPFQARLIHAHFATDGLRALTLARKLQVPLITSLRGYDIYRSRRALFGSGRLSWMFYALFQRRLIDRGDLFLAVSDALRRKAIECGFPADRTVTHYNGVDLDRFRPSGERDHATILHVARLVEKKGTALLMQALATLGDRHGACLEIVGDGPLRKGLEHLAGRLGIVDRVRFYGALPQEAVIELMQRATLLAAPSRAARDGDSEGLPNVVVEAMATGLPVVATDHGGIGEALIDQRTGFVVGENDAGQLASRIGDLLDSRDLGTRMGLAARQVASEKFDFSRQMAKLESYYDDLTCGRANKIRLDTKAH